MIDGWGISCELALRWMSLDLSDDKSTLVQVMAWCRQATSRYPSQCWPSSLSPYAVTMPQWVNYMSNKGWDEIIYPFSNVNGCTVDVWGMMINFTPHFLKDEFTYLCMLGLKLIHVTEGALVQKTVSRFVDIEQSLLSFLCFSGAEWIPILSMRIQYSQ